MEDDGAVKAPVTRLRRRLSVEQSDDVKSPAPATPTKKRGGRLAAKPQLELIDENASDTSSSKKSTRRAAVKDLVDVTEEKPVTPSRRSTRIKSNTSIVSETSLAVDSPRAKRAARRLSQVGSDTETTVTSARKTRRTRKDSSSSIDKLDVTTTTISNNIADESKNNGIDEEQESSSQKSNDTTKENTNAGNTSIRKSPRLLGKKQKGANDRQSTESSNNDNDATVNNTFDDLNISQQNKHLEISPGHETVEKTDQVNNNSTKKSELNLSDSSINIIQNLDKKIKKINSHLNKSTSALDNSNELIKNRHRTNSLTVIVQTNIGDGLFLSDNESSKKKKKRNSLELNKDVIHPGSGDNEATIHTAYSPGNENLNLSREKKNRRDIIFNTYKSLTEKFITPEKTNVSVVTNSLESQNISPEGNKENIDNISSNINDNNSMKSLFEKPPSEVLQSTVYFEDSDSDKEKGSHTPVDAEDQCVPVVENQFENKNKSQIQCDDITDSNVISNNTSLLNKSTEQNYKNNSCEPMDIDETIPNNQSVIIDNPDDKPLDGNEQKILNSSLRRETSMNKSSNKSKRKSSLSTSQNLEKTENENKSTLILSQIKDMSSTDKSVSESPKPSNEMLSKSVNSVEISKTNATDKKKLSLDYSTSTPLQQKKFQKLGMQINTSIINTSNTETKTESKNKTISKKDTSRTSKTSDTSVTGDDETDSEDEEEESKEKNDLINDEAEVASDDYESGDSQDEEERRYEEENEIVGKGETLDSEEDISNDSDYEKDSFVVTSDEEDADLLSGSGDDLSMSDNELSMSKKSKHKFNERKLKEQKKASREMYEARHKLDSSYKETKRKSNKMQIDSSEDSDHDMIVRTKKNKNQRLDSTHDESLDKSVVKKSVSKKKSQRNQLSESSCDEAAKEQEISSVFEGNTTKCEDPLSAKVKQEPNTPVKELDISTVEINQNIEEVEIENNVSMVKTNQTIDPLQATMVNDSEDSSMSENSEIAKNYDSVLNELNNDNQKPKAKSHNTSLNLDKKSKQSAKEPIVDQLNLTQVKAKKKYKVDADVVDSTSNKTQTKEKEQTISANKDNESSSDSIDLQLLFSDDSNNCADAEEATKTKETKEPDEVVEDFIPLKRTPGKINILSGEGKKNTPKNKSFNESVSNKKQKFADEGEAIEIDDGNNDIKIIIDTQGSRGDEDNDNSFNIPLNNSFKKKKNKNNFNVSLKNDSQLHVTNETNNEDDAPLEVSYKSSKNDKKNKESLNPSNFDVLSPNVSGVEILESSVCITESGKKKKKKKLSESQIGIDILESSVCISESGKKKKLSESQSAIDVLESSVCIPESGKKKKKLSESRTGVDLESSVCIPESGKKKKKLSESQTGIELLETSVRVYESGKKKKNLSESQTDTNILESSVSINESGKKKKKKKLSESQTETEAEPAFVQNISFGSAKKQKQKADAVSIEDGNNEVESLNVSVSKPGSHKKNKSLLESQTFEQKDVKASAKQNISLSKSFGSAKKQKQKPALETSVGGDDINDVLELSKTKTGSNKKNKKSLVESQTSVEEPDADKVNISLSISSAKKQKDVVNESVDDTKIVETGNLKKSKKRKRNSSANTVTENEETALDTNEAADMTEAVNISISLGSRKKKQKISQNETTQVQDSGDRKSSSPMSKKEDAIDSKIRETDNQTDFQTAGVQKKKTKKRKERDDDEGNKVTKVFKENSFDKVHVHRLPASILNQLEDKPKKEVLEMKKSTVISTSSFIVEETKRRKNKPSNYLEESVYLNDSYVENKHKVNLKKPKVLPFVPTAVTSDSGFTTNFKINVIPQEVQFVAQTKNAANFKNDYLYGKKIKRLGTYEMYKKNRNAKMSKF